MITYNKLKLSRPRKTPVINSSIKLLRSFKLVKAVKLLNVAYCRFPRNSLPFNELAICYLQISNPHQTEGQNKIKQEWTKKERRTNERMNEMTKMKRER